MSSEKARHIRALRKSRSRRKSDCGDAVIRERYCLGQISDKLRQSFCVSEKRLALTESALALGNGEKPFYICDYFAVGVGGGKRCRVIACVYAYKKLPHFIHRPKSAPPHKFPS